MNYRDYSYIDSLSAPMFKMRVRPTVFNLTKIYPIFTKFYVTLGKSKPYLAMFLLDFGYLEKVPFIHVPILALFLL